MNVLEQPAFEKWWVEESRGVIYLDAGYGLGC